MRQCSVEGCEAKYYGKGLCRKHWARKRRHGTTDDPPKRVTPPERMAAALASRVPSVITCPHPDRKHFGKGMCKPCYMTKWIKDNPQSSAAQWITNNPERYQYLCRRSKLKKYGITPEQFEEMWKQQDGICANPACDAVFDRDVPRSVNVDHCHETGAVRGLLCGRCNRTLGHANDNPDLLVGLVEYVRAAHTQVGSRRDDRR